MLHMQMNDRVSKALDNMHTTQLIQQTFSPFIVLHDGTLIRAMDWRSAGHRFNHLRRNVRRILVMGVNAPLPPQAKKILKI